MVAGLTVNEVPQPVRERRRSWRALFYQVENWPQEFTERKLELTGIANYVKQYNVGLGEKYLTAANLIQV